MQTLRSAQQRQQRQPEIPDFDCGQQSRPGIAPPAASMPDVIDSTLERCQAPETAGSASPEEAIYENPGPLHDASVHEYSPHIADYPRQQQSVQARSLRRRSIDRQLDDVTGDDDVYSAAQMHSVDPEESHYTDSLKYYVLERK